MGLNTALVLLNDHLQDLEAAPDLGAVIRQMVNESGAPQRNRRFPYGYHGLSVIYCQHADYDQIVRIGRNTGELIATGRGFDALLDAAKQLHRTAEPGERRKLIRQIEFEGQMIDDIARRHSMNKPPEVA